MESSEPQSGLKKVVSNRSPRALGTIALLAVIPVAFFALGRSMLAVVAVVNVLLIFGSLYLLTSPTEGGHADEDTGESAVETDESAV